MNKACAASASTRGKGSPCGSAIICNLLTGVRTVAVRFILWPLESSRSKRIITPFGRLFTATSILSGFHLIRLIRGHEAVILSEKKLLVSGETSTINFMKHSSHRGVSCRELCQKCHHLILHPQIAQMTQINYNLSGIIGRNNLRHLRNLRMKNLF